MPAFSNCGDGKYHVDRCFYNADHSLGQLLFRAPDQPPSAPHVLARTAVLSEAGYHIAGIALEDPERRLHNTRGR